MAIAAIAFTNTPSPRADEAGRAQTCARTDEDAQYPLRRVAAAPDIRVPPRVYSPFPSRRLARPMAVRADAETAGAHPGRTRWLVFRGRRDTTRSA